MMQRVRSTHRNRWRPSQTVSQTARKTVRQIVIERPFPRYLQASFFLFCCSLLYNLPQLSASTQRLLQKCVLWGSELWNLQILVVCRSMQNMASIFTRCDRPVLGSIIVLLYFLFQCKHWREQREERTGRACGTYRAGLKSPLAVGPWRGSEHTVALRGSL